MEMKGRCFSLGTPAIARLVPELVPPISIARFWASIHSRAFEAATSALFWWSAVSTSIGRFSTLPPKSSTAHFTISAPAGPSMSAYRLAMSVMKPMRTGPALFCAVAARLPRPKAMAATRVLIFMEASPWEKSRWRLDAEVFLQHGHVVPQLVLREFAHDLAVLHDVEAVGQRRGEAE